MIFDRTPSSRTGADPSRRRSPKKEYTFHIDLGIEFLFHLAIARTGSDSDRPLPCRA
jgi:hypothetical protein